MVLLLSFNTLTVKEEMTLPIFARSASSLLFSLLIVILEHATITLFPIRIKELTMNQLSSFSLQTTKHDQMIEITHDVMQIVTASKIQNGMALVYCPHTTAGIAINENADPDVVRDVLRRLDEQYPWDHQLDRHSEGNTAAHMKAITTGTSQMIIIERGRLLLGTWQGIYFCEFDGPRTRTVQIKLIAT